MDETEQLIFEQFKQLPQDVQDAITSNRVREQIKAIGEKHQLHIDQIGSLETETTFIMIGLEPAKDYIRNIARELRLDGATAQKIAVDVNEQIFRPVRESLKKIHEIADTDSTTPTPLPQNTEIPESLKTTIEKPITSTPPQTTVNIPLQETVGTLLRLKKDVTPTVRPTLMGGTTIETKEDGRPFFKVTPQKSPDTLAPAFKPPITNLQSSVPQIQTQDIQKQSQKIVSPPPNLPTQTPLQQQTPPAIIRSNSVEDKLTKTFSIPRAETEYKESSTETPKRDSNYGKNDPYREPIG